MQSDLTIVMLSAAAIGMIHTLAGPDHYLPFVALQNSRRWSMRKTLFITSLCGLGHTGSTVLIGILIIAMGISLQSLEWLEALRGDWAAWMLFLFGIAYCCWGLYRSWSYPSDKQRKHEQELETAHSHNHHKPMRKPWKELTPWLLFLIFVLGPCEPLLPLLIYPSAKGQWRGLVLIALAFTLATVLTMVIVVAVLVKGLSFTSKWSPARYAHIMAGAIIALCGAGMLFMGL